MILSIAYFVVAVRKTVACQAHAEVGVGPERVGEPQFRIKINRSDGHAEREVIAIKIRPVQIIKSVGRDGSVSPERSIVTEMQKLSLVRIDLRPSRNAAYP